VDVLQNISGSLEIPAISGVVLRKK
jgi:hypothetical protein